MWKNVLTAMQQTRSTEFTGTDAGAASVKKDFWDLGRVAARKTENTP
jgi:hypothetical protein